MAANCDVATTKEPTTRSRFRIRIPHLRKHSIGKNQPGISTRNSTDGYPGAGFSGSTPQSSALGTTESIISIDALEEFRATTSSYSAEYGRTPGGQFSFSSRSGTNEWHGTAFDFLRNDALDARNVFDTTKLGFYHPENFGNTAFSKGDGLYLTTNGASSDYNALQVRFNRRLAQGFQILASYTWAHALDNASSNFAVYDLQRSSSDFDVRHNLQMAASYDIGGHYSNSVASYLLRHWSFDARVSARSALPVRVGTR